ncbi:MAG: helix-turn-helix domain-containing protein [Clostridiales bacterium]|jgi:transcriptional regulator with XRE-family HTH domain|nr:helix-turn-helix domain-containing protein [Clostridiales bacterium]
MSFGEKLRTARKSRGYTQEFVASSIGIATSTYSQYEGDSRTPYIEGMRKLSEVLRVSPDYLMEWVDIKLKSIDVDHQHNTLDIRVSITNVGITSECMLDGFFYPEYAKSEEELNKKAIALEVSIELPKINNNLDFSNNNSVILSTFSKMPDFVSEKFKNEISNFLLDFFENPIGGVFVTLYFKNKVPLTSIRLMDNVASAGSGAFLEGAGYHIVELPNGPKGANFAVQIRGDSMEPMFEDGEVVFIKEQPEIEIGEIGLFVYSETGYLKQLGEGMLLSLNPKYKPIIIEKYETFKCCGKVIR